MPDDYVLAQLERMQKEIDRLRDDPPFVRMDLFEAVRQHWGERMGRLERNHRMWLTILVGPLIVALFSALAFAILQ